MSEIKPQVVCITETHLDKDEKITIEGYRIFDNNNKKGKGGIIIGVKDNLKNITIETEKICDKYQTLWIRIDNKNNKINIGTVYAPQESKNNLKVFNDMYKTIQDKVTRIKHDGERLVLNGDFNAKIGKIIKDNKEEVSKSGKVLLQMTLEEDLNIVNTNEKCEGKWTRILNNEKSVLEYMIIRQEDEKYVDSIRIDEEKMNTPRYKNKNKQYTYTDHCSIILTMKWTEANIERARNEKTMVINEETLEKFNQCTNGTELTQIAGTNEGLDIKYEKWEKTMTRIIAECFEKGKSRKKIEIKAERNLNELKRMIRKKRADPKKKKQQIKALNELMEIEIKRYNANKTMKTAMHIGQNGKLSSGAFWEFKKRMDSNNRRETPSSMLDKNNIERNSKDEIKTIFKEFYQDLFLPNQPSSDMEKLCHRATDTAFNLIMEEAERSDEVKREFSEEEIEKAIKETKGKFSLDSKGISNKIVKYGGKDFAESSRLLFNQIDKENIGPVQWEEMIINSIYKGKKNKKSMENRRGLFLTNVISKLFEKAKLQRQRNIIESAISPFQNGGIQHRSRADNQMILNATIDYNNLLDCETYIFFADAYKCFDKLDLKTCIIDLYKITGSQDAKLKYNLNRRSKITIKTPVGVTDQIEVGEIVKQGTLNGPILCNISTDKVNKVGRKSTTTIGPNINCEASIFVDDIQQAGSQTHNIETAANNCAVMEITRKVTFNVGTDKTAFLIVNPKRNNTMDKLRNQIKRGEIERTKEYKYVGEWYTEEGTHKKSLSEKEKKVPVLTNKVKYYGDPYKVGDLALQVRLVIYISTVIPTLFTNIETWSTITSKEIDQLEKMQKDILTSIMDLPKSTPYMGLLSELGLWPVQQLMEYNRLVLVHQIFNSDDKRVLKHVIIDQYERPYSGCWMETTREICTKYNVEIDRLTLTNKPKFKKIIKSKINQILNTQITQLATEKTKLRFCETKIYRNT